MLTRLSPGLPLAVALAVAIIGGCRITNLPNGDNYKSPITQTTIRLVIDEVVDRLELPDVDGRTVRVTSIGFDAGGADVREYLRYAAGRSLVGSGAKLVTGADSDLELNMIVNACGADHATNYILPIWSGVEQRATLDIEFELLRADGTRVHGEHLVARSLYMESNLLVIIQLPGRYEIYRDGKWRRVDGFFDDMDGMLDIPVAIGQ